MTISARFCVTKHAEHLAVLGANPAKISWFTGFPIVKTMVQAKIFVPQMIIFGKNSDNFVRFREKFRVAIDGHFLC